MSKAKPPAIAPELSGLPHVPVDALEPLQGELKTLSKREYNKLKKSLTEHGIIVPFFVWQEAGRLLDGHQRQRVMVSEGWHIDVPVVYISAVDEQDAKRKLLVISSQYGRVNQEGWDAFTFDLDDGWLQETVHFDALPFVFGEWGDEDEPAASADAEPQVNRAAALAEEYGTAVGQLWQLGRHRLAIGDCTDPAVVERLTNGERAKYGMHDPPYGINVVVAADSGGDKPFGTGSIGFHGVVRTNVYSPVEGDDKPFDPAHLLALSDYQVMWGGNYYADKLTPQKGWIVWDKKGRDDWRDNFSDCELAWTNLPIVTRIFRHTWMGMVQEGERETRYHPTQKPAALYEKIMQECFKADGVVIDLYCGSGPTLIACERVGRTCFACEIDPGYAAVCLERYWQAFGIRPELIQ